MADEKPPPLMTRFFHGCLLLLGGIIAIALGLELLSQLWGWVALVAIIVAVVWLAVLLVRWNSDRRW